MSITEALVIASSGIRGINNSPGIRGINNSPVIRGINNSPGIRGISNSPVIRGINNSPVIRGISNSPGIRGINNSPVIRGINNSPVFAMSITEALVIASLNVNANPELLLVHCLHSVSLLRSLYVFFSCSNIDTKEDNTFNTVVTEENTCYMCRYYRNHCHWNTSTHYDNHLLANRIIINSSQYSTIHRLLETRRILSRVITTLE